MSFLDEWRKDMDSKTGRGGTSSGGSSSGTSFLDSWRAGMDAEKAQQQALKAQEKETVAIGAMPAAERRAEEQAPEVTQKTLTAVEEQKPLDVAQRQGSQMSYYSMPVYDEAQDAQLADSVKKAEAGVTATGWKADRRITELDQIGADLENAYNVVEQAKAAYEADPRAVTKIQYDNATASYNAVFDTYQAKRNETEAAIGEYQNASGNYHNAYNAYADYQRAGAADYTRWKETVRRDSGAIQTELLSASDAAAAAEQRLNRAKQAANALNSANIWDTGLANPQTARNAAAEELAAAQADYDQKEQRRAMLEEELGYSNALYGAKTAAPQYQGTPEKFTAGNAAAIPSTVRMGEQKAEAALTDNEKLYTANSVQKSRDAVAQAKKNYNATRKNTRRLQSMLDGDPTLKNDPQFMAEYNKAVQEERSLWGDVEKAKQERTTTEENYWTGKNELRFGNVSENEDFSSQKGVDSSTQDFLYRYVNNLGDARKEGIPEYQEDGLGHQLNNLGIKGNSVGQQIEAMNQDEVDTFNYLWKTKGKEEAKAYLEDYLSSSLSQRVMNDKITKWEDRSSGLLGGIYTSAASVPMNLASGVGYIDLAVQKIRNYAEAEGRPLDYNSAAMIPGRVSSAIREKVADNISQSVGNKLGSSYASVASFLYQTGMSMADSAVVAGITALGIPGAAWLLGGSAATQAAIETKERGGTDGQALFYGLAAGVAEEFFEKVSLDKLLSGNVPKNTREWVKSVLSQAGVEGSEEVFTTLANTVTDAIINGNVSDLQTKVQQYQQLGYQDAEKRAWKDWALGLIADGIGGALSGGVMGSGRSAIVTARYDSIKISNDTAVEKLKKGYLTDMQVLKLSYNESEMQKLREEGVLTEQLSDNDLDRIAQVETALYNKLVTDTAEKQIRQEETQQTEQNELKTPGTVQTTAEAKVEEARNRLIELGVAEAYAEKLAQDIGLVMTGTVSNEIANEIRVSQSAVQVLKEMSGTDVTRQTASEMRAAIKKVAEGKTLQLPGENQNTAESEKNDSKSDTNYTETQEAPLFRETAAETQQTAAETQQETAQTQQTETVSQDSTKNPVQKETAMRRYQDSATAEETSLKQQGVQIGTDAQIRIMPESTWDAEMRTVAQAVRDSGMEPVFVAGKLKVRTENGVKTVGTVTNGNQLYIHATNATRTVRELAEQATGKSIEIKAEEQRRKPQTKAEKREEAARSTARQYHVSEEKTEQAVRLASLLKKEIRFYYEEAIKDENGKESWDNGYTANGVIYVNAAVDKKPVVWVVAHELTHNVENTAAYKALRRICKRELGSNYDALVNREIRIAEKFGEKYGKEQGEQEVVANWVANELLISEELIQRMVDYEPSASEKIRDFLQRIRNGLGMEDNTIDVAIGRFSMALQRAQQKGNERQNSFEVEYSEEAERETRQVLEANGIAVADDNVPVAMSLADLMQGKFHKPMGVSDIAQYSHETMDTWSERFLAEAKRNNPELNTGEILSLIKNWDDMLWRQESYDNAEEYQQMMRLLPKGNYSKSKFGPLRTNVEYRRTFDMDTSCPRTFQFLAYRDELQKRFGRPLTYNESINLLEIMKAYGQMIPCTYCYVENKRTLKAGYYNEWFATRRAVMEAKSNKLARADIMKRMYGYDSKKKTLTSAAEKVFNAWLGDENGYNPTIEENFETTNLLRNSILRYLDQKLEDGVIETDSTLESVTNIAADYYGITDENACKMIRKMAEDWRYDWQRGDGNHSVLMETEGIITPEEAKRRNAERALILDYDATSYANAASSSKKVENYSPYDGQLDQIPEEDKAYIIAMGGIRKHSSNDFRIDYVLDYFQFYADLAAGKWTGHTYTKNLDYVQIFGRTGDRINVSIAFSETTDGVLENAQEGAEWKKAQELREAYKENVGIMAMATSDRQLSYALNADWIDMCIPFHSSGLATVVWKNLRAWTDYTSKQNERMYSGEEMKAALKAKGISISNLKAAEIKSLFDSTFDIKRCIGTEGKKNGKEFAPHFYPKESVQNGVKIPGHNNDAARYLALCKEYGCHPRFEGTIVEDKDGNPIDITDHPAYIKVIKETAKAETPQSEIRFNFNEVDPYLTEKYGREMGKSAVTPFDYATWRLQQEAANGGYENMKADDFRIVDQFAEEYMGKNREIGWLSEKAEMLKYEIGREVALKQEEYRLKFLEEYNRMAEENKKKKKKPDAPARNVYADEARNEKQHSYGSEDAEYLELAQDPEGNWEDIRWSRDYSKAIDLLDRDELIRREDTHIQVLDHTPQIYIDKAKAKNRRIIMSWETAYLAMKKAGSIPGNYHNLGAELMKQVPEKLKDPEYIVIRPDGRINALLELRRVNRPVMVSVEMEAFQTTIQENKNDDDTYNLIVTVMDPKINYLKNNIFGKSKIVHNKNEEDPAHFISRLQLSQNATTPTNDLARSSGTHYTTDETEVKKEQNSFETESVEELDTDEKRDAAKNDVQYMEDGKNRYSDTQIGERVQYSYDSDYEEAFEPLRDENGNIIYLYKAFYAKDGKLYPPMVANLSEYEKKGAGTMKGLDTPVGIVLVADVGKLGRYTADATEFEVMFRELWKGKSEEIKELKAELEQRGIDTTTAEGKRIAMDELEKRSKKLQKASKTKLAEKRGDLVRNKYGRLAVVNAKGGGTLAFRPGWHLGMWPDAKQFNKDSKLGKKTVMPDGLVFCKCEIAGNIDYQLDAMSYGMKSNGKFDRTQAGLPMVPENGYYVYRTNVDPTTAPWYITGAMRVVEVLDDDDCAEICGRYGVTMSPRESGKKINLEDYGLKRGKVTPTENKQDYAENTKNRENLEELKAALTDPMYTVAYTRRAINFNDEQIQREFEINKQNPEYYRSIAEGNGNEYLRRGRQYSRETADAFFGKAYTNRDTGYKGREKFKGTKATNALGIQIAGSVGIYGMTESIKANERALYKTRQQIRNMIRDNTMTQAEQEFAKGVAEGTYDIKYVPKNMRADLVQELADQYFVEESYSGDTLAGIRQRINEELQWKAQELLDEADFKPESMLLLNERTSDRNLRAMFGDRLGKQVWEWAFRPIEDNANEIVRFYNNQMDAVRLIEDSTGKKRELTRQESMLTMMLMEGRAAAEQVASMEMSEAVKGAAEKVNAGTELQDAMEGEKLDTMSKEQRKAVEQYARWLHVQDAMKDGDSTIIENAADIYRKQFDKFYDAINEVLTAHGYAPIGFIRGYAPHVQPEDTQNAFQRAMNNLGINNKVSKLPTDIAGRTADFKPNKRWVPYFLQRHGTETEYDIVKQYQSYVDYIGDVIYHIDDIMRLRQLSNYLRKTYSGKEIQNNLEWAENLRYMPKEEKLKWLKGEGVVQEQTQLSAADTNAALEEYVAKLYDNIKTTGKYGNLVMWLDNYANILAAKQSMADRGWEYSVGREALNIGNKVQGAFQRANVAGNLSSVLNQMSQISSIYGETGQYFYKAIRDIMSGKTRKADWNKRSDFLTARTGKEMLYTEMADRIVSAMFKPAQLADELVSTIAVRAAYLQAAAQGANEQEAMRQADLFARKVMASRIKGVQPLAYQSKGFFSRMAHMFQVECANSWDHIVSDLPDDFRRIAASGGKDKAIAALVGVILRTLVGGFLLNRITEGIYGGTPAQFDIFGLSANFIASGKGLTTNKYLKTVFDNVWEKMNGERLFETKPLQSGFDTGAAIEDIGYNVSNELPFVRNVAGIFGVGDQSMALPGSNGEFSNLVESGRNLFKDGVSDGEIASFLTAVLSAASTIAPGGRQIAKTVGGINTAVQGGSYKNGKMQYAVSGGDAVRGILFGKNATKAARDYYAAGAKMLTEAQTKATDVLENAGMSTQDAYDSVKGYADAYTAARTNKENTTAVRHNYVAKLNISEDSKMDVLEALGETDDQLKRINTLMKQGITVNGATKAIDKYNEIEDNGKETEARRKEFAKWLRSSSYTSKQKETIWQMLTGRKTSYTEVLETKKKDADYELKLPS